MKWPLGRRRDQELEEEIQAHLAMAVRDRIERGETAESAERAAGHEFGNVALIQETRARCGAGAGLSGCGRTSDMQREACAGLRGSLPSR